MALDFDKLQEYAVANFSQYLRVTVNTLTHPGMHFAPLAVHEDGKEVTLPADAAGSLLNPQLVGFAVLSMFLGLTMNSLITKMPDRKDFFVIEVVGLLFWVLYAAIVHLICKIFRGTGSFLETVSVTIQIFATLYVVCSSVATTLSMIVLVKPVNHWLSSRGEIAEMIANYPVTFFFLIHTILLMIYLPRGLKPIHNFKLWQQIGVALPTGVLVLLHGVVMIILTGNLWSIEPEPDLAADPPAAAAAPHPSPQASLRVLTLNMAGLRYPPRLGWMADQTDCAARFRTAGEHIRAANPPYDIVAIQELYRTADLHIVTCDPAPFLEAVATSGDRVLFSPKGENWALEADGGIGVLTPHSIESSEAVRFDGSGGPFRAARGAIFARIALPNSSARIDAYIVHLSPGHLNSAQRKRELESLSKLIAAKSPARANPLLILGDFNIEGPPHAGPEYSNIVSLLGSPRDLWLDDYSADPGYTFDCVANAVAAKKPCDYQARIDYIWIAPNTGGYQVRVHSVKKVEWRTDRLPISDHYGLEAFLTIEPAF